MVVIKGYKQNKVLWKLGIIIEVYPGKDGKMKVVNFRTGKSISISGKINKAPATVRVACDIIAPAQEHKANVEGEDFWPGRNASDILRVWINGLTKNVREGPINE